jgi:PhzF family phenazine biosynthesis protein
VLRTASRSRQRRSRRLRWQVRRDPGEAIDRTRELPLDPEQALVALRRRFDGLIVLRPRDLCWARVRRIGDHRRVNVPFFQVDAFARRRFTGNPAAVMVLDRFLEDAVLQAIAAENNLAETAFLVAEGDDFRLRWFTPTVEVPLCGHATLASAAVVMERLSPGRTRVVFRSASGPLTVTRSTEGYMMDFPARRPLPIAAPPAFVEALGVMPIEVLADSFNYLALLASARQVRDIAPDLDAIAKLDRGGVIVTAPGDGEFDFVSRYFAPAKGIPEDPVTGGAHCALAPYWASKRNQTAFRAFQASRRGGEIACRVSGDRVELEGGCVFYVEGRAEI